MSSTGSSKARGSFLTNMLSNNLKEPSNSITKPYRFYFNNEQQMINVFIELPPETKLINAISRFQQIVSCNDSPLDQNPQKYELNIPQKNGSPKTDFPSNLIDLTLEMTGKQTFSLVHKTFKEKETKKKCTYDFNGSISPVTQPLKSENVDNIKGQKNCILRILCCEGC